MTSSPPDRGLLRRFAPLIFTIVFALVAATVIVVSVNDGGASTVAVPCTSRTRVVVAASSEKWRLLEKLAGRYNATTARPTEHCADVAVTRVNSGDAAVAFNRGWNTQTQGEFPDVWSPASSSWAGYARGMSAAGSDVVPESGPSLAQTPLVIAMPRPMAERLGWPNRALGWSDLAAYAADPRGWGAFDRPQWGRFTLGKTDPTVSTSGLNALLGAFQAAPGSSSGDELTVAKVRDAEANGFERSLEQGVVHYGSTELEFLENLYRAGSRSPDGALRYVSAVAVEEKSVWDYNVGNPSGDPRDLGLRPDPAVSGVEGDRQVGAAPIAPAVPLVAFHPSGGTYVSDSPYLVRRDVSGDKRTAAEDFGRWLLEPTQQQAFQRAGFRDAAGEPGVELSEPNGFPATPPRPLPLPPANAVSAALQAWPGLRKPANVTLVLDRSGSMGPPPAGKEPPTNLDIVRPAAFEAVARLAPGDTLSLWTFSSADGGQPPYRLDVPPTPVIKVLPLLHQVLDNLDTEGDTALYRTSRDIVQSSRSSYDPTKINAIVLLTDGQETVEATPRTDPAFRSSDVARNEAALQATQAAIASDPDRPTRVFYIAYSGESDLGTLRKLGLASGGYAYNAQQPAQIQQAFKDVISNF